MSLCTTSYNFTNYVTELCEKKKQPLSETQKVIILNAIEALIRKVDYALETTSFISDD